MKKPLLLLLIIIGFTRLAFGQKTQKILEKSNVNHFYTCSLDLMFDSLSMDYHINIVFERDSMKKFDVAEHYFNETLKFVLTKVCRENRLNYWIESDGTIYILQNTDDLARLKLENKRNHTSLGNVKPLIEDAKAPPMHFKFSVSGRVIDQASGESLPSATVIVRNTNLSTSTNTDGSFIIFNVPSDTCVVEASFSGYQTDYIRLSPKNIGTDLVFGMFKALNTLNEVTVLGKKSGVMNTDTKKVGVLTLTPAALDKLPNIGEKDILRAFQLMPGVGATNESSSGAYVRGGTPDQNLVVFDGFTIYQVDHLYGFFSAFNANAVKDVQLYKGGFSSEYGGRLASVTEINGKDGNQKEGDFGVDLSLLSVNAFADFPVSNNSSLLIAFRRSYQGPFYDKIFQQFNTSTVQGGPGGGGGGPPGGGGFGESTIPASHFYDADIRYNIRIDHDNTITWSLYNGEDVTNNSRALQIPAFLSSSTGGINITDFTKYGNTGSSLKWFKQWNKKTYSNTYITYSSYFNNRTNAASGTTTDDEGNATAFDNGTVEDNNLKDFGFKSNWTTQVNSTLKLLYGGFGNYQKINYDYIQNDTSYLISEHNGAFSGGGFAEAEIDPDNKLHLQPGIRTTFFQPTGKLYVEPRLSASYVINDNYTVKFATGQFYQYMNEVTREDLENGNREFWVLSNNTNIPVGEANHYMGGISYENDLFLIDLEGYYKTLSNITQYTVQNLGFMPGSTGQTVQQNFFTGSGRDEGVELLLQKKLGNYTGWIGYTLASADEKFAAYGNTWIPADQDVRNEFKTVNMYHYNRWNFSGVFIFSTGHPYTAPLSSYTVTTADGNAVSSFNVSGRNALRYPDYNRLDLSATYDLIKINGNKIGSIGLSLFNVYDHTNIWYREYQLVNNEVITSNVDYLGFTPNITLSLRWK